MYPHDMMANTFASFTGTTILMVLRKLATRVASTRLLKPRSLLRQCGKQNDFTVTWIRQWLRKIKNRNEVAGRELVRQSQEPDGAGSHKSC
jgi:hypothetical protein